MTNQPPPTFCWEASYLNYRRLSHKARCSMAPRNCPWEIMELVTLKTGKRVQIFYCTFVPENEKFNSIKEQSKEHLKPLNKKTSCRLDGT